MRLLEEQDKYQAVESLGGGYVSYDTTQPTYEGAGAVTILEEIPFPTNNNNMMLAIAAPAEQITAQPYDVNAYAVDNSELGLEALPTQLIDNPTTGQKKWLIVGVVVVLVAIGYFIYKQSKNDKKKY